MEMRESDRSQLGEGRYANFFEIGHNAFGFVFDFGQLGLDAEPPRIYMRVITSPSGARKLCQLLNEALAEYLNAFGPMQPDDE